jgi:selenophosphate synthetase-related protein
MKREVAMQVSLPQVVKEVREYSGLTRKQPVEAVFNELILNAAPGPALPNFGDDAAVIPWNDGYLLFSADGLMPRLLINEPYAAGKAAVMVTVNDIYAMGGKPIAMVNVLASGNEKHRAQVVKGIKRGCEKLRVPMVGGHLHPDASPDAPALSVSILGWTKHVLHGYKAQAGDDLIFAADLNGRIGCHSVISWDANSGKSPDELINRLEALPIIAERGWAHSAKDVSNAGILGTASIMMENSGVGASIDLEALPIPAGMDFHSWLFSFQSFGFIMSAPPEISRSIIALFEERKVTAAVIGKVVEERKVMVRSGSDVAVMFDFIKDKITGISYRPNP